MEYLSIKADMFRWSSATLLLKPVHAGIIFAMFNYFIDRYRPLAGLRIELE